MDFNDNYFDDDFYNEDCDDFLRLAGCIYEHYLESVSEDDFIINPPQMQKFIDLVNFISKKSKKERFEVDPLLFSKKDCNAEITIRGFVLDLYLGEVAEFCNLVKDSCNIYLETNRNNEICLTILFKDVFVRKDESDYLA